MAAATSVLAVIELVNALRKYGLGGEVKRVVDAVFSLNIAVLQVDSTDVREGAGIFDRFRMSPYDCVHVAVMKRAGIKEIVSADRDFHKVTDVTRLDPHQLYRKLKVPQPTAGEERRWSRDGLGPRSCL